MAKLGDLFGHGVLASRPAAGIVGRHYFATDSTPPTMYRDNGSTWDAEADAGGGGGAATFSGVRAAVTGGSFGTGSYVAIPFDAADVIDTDGYHDPASNNTRLTVPTGKGGTFLALLGVAHDHTGYAYIRKNGSAIAGAYAIITGSGTTVGGMSSLLSLADGDYLEAMCSVASGTLESNTAFSLIRLG